MSDDPAGDVDGVAERAATLAASLAASYKVRGKFASDTGAAVLGYNTAGSGTPVGVQGVVDANGYGLETPDDARVEGDIEATSGHTLTVDGVPTLRLGPIGNDQFNNKSGGNVVAGWKLNDADGTVGATIAGGGRDVLLGSNRVTDNFGTVGGGESNRAGDNQSGSENAITATVSGGSSNTAEGKQSTVGGGRLNGARKLWSTVGGGVANEAKAESATIGGGDDNEILNKRGTIAGGAGNEVFGDKGTVGGGTTNTVKEIGATVAGGSKNNATGVLSTVCGGSDNTAGNRATVGGGVDNDATGSYSFVGGGDNNDAIKQNSTVAGGLGNEARGGGAVIAGGSGNEAFGDASVIAGGVNNRTGKSGTTKGTWSMIPGGKDNRAEGKWAFAAGRKAKAKHEGALVWSDSSDTAVSSTGADQVLLRASGGVGIRTDSSPDSNFPRTPLHVTDEFAGVARDNPGKNVVLLENTSSKSGPNVLGIKAGPSPPDGKVNFVTFYDRTGNSIGAIEGKTQSDGTGGVEYKSGDADLAEYFPKADPDATVDPGDVVGLEDGEIVTDPRSADLALVVSTAPMVSGNVPEEDDDYVRATLLGQVPVAVRGAVESGDLLVAGPGHALAREECDRADPLVVGLALESADGTGEVRALVGQPGVDGSEGDTGERETENERLREEVTALREENAALRERLAAVEAHVGMDATTPATADD